MFLQYCQPFFLACGRDFADYCRNELDFLVGLLQSQKSSFPIVNWCAKCA